MPGGQRRRHGKPERLRRRVDRALRTVARSRPRRLRSRDRWRAPCIKPGGCGGGGAAARDGPPPRRWPRAPRRSGALARRLGEAVPPAGFKIGATAGKHIAGLSRPVRPGRRLHRRARGLHARPAATRLADFRASASSASSPSASAATCQPAPARARQATAAVGRLMAGIELVENRYGAAADPRSARRRLIADQVFHAAAILGRPGPRTGARWTSPACEGPRRRAMATERGQRRTRRTTCWAIR
jgi:hypothetical protein